MKRKTTKVEPVAMLVAETAPVAVQQLVHTNAAAVRARREARERLAELVDVKGPNFDDPLLAAEVLRVRELEDQAHASGTRHEYRKAFEAFERWCRRRGYTPLPAAIDTLRLYLKDQALGPTARTQKGKKPRSLGVVVAAIGYEHNVHGLVSPHQSPAIRRILKGIRNEKGLAPKQKAPIDTSVLHMLLDAIDADVASFEPRALAPEQVDAKNRSRAKNGRAKQVEGRALRAKRDRALFLLTFGGAMRRDEVTSLLIDQIHIEKEGLRVWIDKSKTDQERRGEWVYIPKGSGDACPVKALQAWLEALRTRGVTFGDAFLAVDQWGGLGPALYGKDVARIVKKRGQQAGLNAALLSGHSFRAGFATSAAKAKKPLTKIMEQGRWKKADTALGYVRMAQGFVDNPADGLFDKPVES